MEKKEKAPYVDRELKAKYMEIIKSDTCFCGLPKQPGYAICRNDYMALPLELRSGLMKRIGHGFEKAYEDAKNYLLKF